MLLSVMPVAFAAEKSVKDTFIEEYIKSLAYHENVYEHDAEHGPDTINVGDEVVLELLKTNDEEKMLEYIERMKESNSRVEEDIAKGNLIVVIDVYDFAEAFVNILVAYSDPARAEIYDGIAERNPAWSEEGENAFGIMYELRENGGTQAEFDVYEEIVVNAIDLCIKHMYGEHDFVEYISNNDATEEADGTKTATCEFCGATDTVVDEGSKLVSDDNCSCNCHKNGLMGIIWKILKFFYKIFGMNKTCSCGVAHY